MPYAMREIIKEEVTVILEADIIELSKSAYCSPVVIVRKKDGSNRFYINIRKQRCQPSVPKNPENEGTVCPSWGRVWEGAGTPP